MLWLHMRKEVTQCCGFGKNEARHILKTFLNTPWAQDSSAECEESQHWRQTRNQRGFKLGNVATYTEVLDVHDP